MTYVSGHAESANQIRQRCLRTGDGCVAAHCRNGCTGTETAVNPDALQHEVGSDYSGSPAVGSERTASTRPVHMHGLIND